MLYSRVNIVTLVDCPHCHKTMEVDSEWDTREENVECLTCGKDFVAYIDPDTYGDDDDGVFEVEDEEYDDSEFLPRMDNVIYLDKLKEKYKKT